MGLLQPTKAVFSLQNTIGLQFPPAQVVLSPALSPLRPSRKAETMRSFPFFLYLHPQVQRSVLQELKRHFSVNGGVGVGGGCNITDACLFHSENIGRRRRVKVVRGYPSFLIRTEQHVFRWGHCNLLWEPVGNRFSFPQAHRPTTVVPSGPFCCGVEADGECGQRSCHYSAPKVFIVARSRMASTGDDNCRVCACSPEYWPLLPEPRVAGALMPLFWCPLFCASSLSFKVRLTCCRNGYESCPSL